MAASGFTPVQLYYSTTATNVPLAANLVAGELAINTADGKLYYKNTSGVVTLLAGLSGYSGISGYSGFSGISGYSGSGISGYSGAGISGYSGVSGYSGFSGFNGSTGMVAFFAMTAAPSGWLAADGTAVSRTTYAALFAAIGTTFGVGDGSTTFNLPNMGGQFPRGWISGQATDPSRTFGSTQAGNFASHTHTMLPGFALNGRVGAQGGPTTAVFADGGVTDTAATGGTETRPTNVALLACIKI